MSGASLEKDRAESLYDYRSWGTPKNFEQFLYHSTMTTTSSVFDVTMGSVKWGLGMVTMWVELPYMYLMQDYSHCPLVVQGIGDFMQATDIWFFWLGHTLAYISGESLSQRAITVH